MPSPLAVESGMLLRKMSPTAPTFWPPQWIEAYNRIPVGAVVEVILITTLTPPHPDRHVEFDVVFVSTQPGVYDRLMSSYIAIRQTWVTAEHFEIV